MSILKLLFLLSDPAFLWKGPILMAKSIHWGPGYLCNNVVIGTSKCGNFGTWLTLMCPNVSIFNMEIRALQKLCGKMDWKGKYWAKFRNACSQFYNMIIPWKLFKHMDLKCMPSIFHEHFIWKASNKKRRTERKQRMRERERGRKGKRKRERRCFIHWLTLQMVSTAKPDQVETRSQELHPGPSWEARKTLVPLRILLLSQAG